MIESTCRKDCNLVIENQEIIKFIIDWLYGSIESFSKLLKAINIYPSRFFNYNLFESKFDCKTTNGKRVQIELRQDPCKELVVHDEFGVSRVFNLHECSSKRELVLKSIVVKKNDLIFTYYFCENFCNMIVNIKKYIVEFSCKVNSTERLLNVEDLFNNIQLPVTAQEILSKAIEVSDLCLEKYVAISVKKNEKNNFIVFANERLISRVIMKNGRYEDFVVSENDESVVYGVSKNGDWFYSTPTMMYRYRNATKTITTKVVVENADLKTLHNIGEKAYEKIKAIQDKVC